MKILDSEYAGVREFSEYPFELSSFQKHAIEALDAGDNVLVTAGTGSGKTLVAEHVIQHRRRGKKILYTAPIKALSNCLFNEFTRKFSDISFGIMTGDIKFNPDADCIIMTTEILRNLLYNNKIRGSGADATVVQLSLEIDVYADVSAVIFDEVHYIADSHRGKVWEECLVLLPSEVQLLMLSATIDKPEKFGQWVEDIKKVPLTLTMYHSRVVPLHHYIYFHLNSKMIKLDTHDWHTRFHDKLTPLLDPDSTFHTEAYETSMRLKKKFGKFIPKTAVFNNITKMLQAQGLLPCIMFTLSRKKCEQYSQSIVSVLNSPEEQSLAVKTFDSLLRKTGNFDTLTQLNEYHTLRRLLQKGIAYHHSGLYHTFKEAIEMLLAHRHPTSGAYQPLVKLLFATETFAVGVNMPTKCVCYTGLTKFSSEAGGFRQLESHEYKQMSGRAGRRGIDKQGVAIILPNMYDLPSLLDMQRMMNGKNKAIFSQFTPNFKCILKLALIGKGQLDQFLRKTLLDQELQQHSTRIATQLKNLPDAVQTSDYSFCEKYGQLMNPKMPGTSIYYSKKMHKKRLKQALQLRQSMPNFEAKLAQYSKYQVEIRMQKDLQEELDSNSEYLSRKIRRVLDFLQEMGYMHPMEDTSGLCPSLTPASVTQYGLMASQINECNEILFCEILKQGHLDGLTAPQIACVASLFIESSEEVYLRDVKVASGPLKQCLEAIFSTTHRRVLEAVDKHGVCLDYVWDLSLTHVDPILDWMSQKYTFQEIVTTYDMFSGNFVKHCIKVNNIVQDIVKMSQVIGKLSIMEEASKVEAILIRENVNVESLYV